ncbi:hypothetical protein HK098_004399 [Nowakowskiella sp. JEL0407]|nr:hypothetical protein HK098_004399 [Nowakowskiella sp. JEL0407]
MNCMILFATPFSLWLLANVSDNYAITQELILSTISNALLFSVYAAVEFGWKRPYDGASQTSFSTSTQQTSGTISPRDMKSFSFSSIALAAVNLFTNAKRTHQNDYDDNSFTIFRRSSTKEMSRWYEKQIAIDAGMFYLMVIIGYTLAITFPVKRAVQHDLRGWKLLNEDRNIELLKQYEKFLEEKEEQELSKENVHNIVKSSSSLSLKEVQNLPRVKRSFSADFSVKTSNRSKHVTLKGQKTIYPEITQNKKIKENAVRSSKNILKTAEINGESESTIPELSRNGFYRVLEDPKFFAELQKFAATDFSTENVVFIKSYREIVRKVRKWYESQEIKKQKDSRESEELKQNLGSSTAKPKVTIDVSMKEKDATENSLSPHLKTPQTLRFSKNSLVSRNPSKRKLDDSAIASENAPRVTICRKKRPVEPVRTLNLFLLLPSTSENFMIEYQTIYSPQFQLPPDPIPETLKSIYMDLYRAHFQSDGEFELNIPGKMLHNVRYIVSKEDMKLDIFDNAKEEVVKMLYLNTYRFVIFSYTVCALSKNFPASGAK